MASSPNPPPPRPLPARRRDGLLSLAGLRAHRRTEIGRGGGAGRHAIGPSQAVTSAGSGLVISSSPPVSSSVLRPDRMIGQPPLVLSKVAFSLVKPSCVTESRQASPICVISQTTRVGASFTLESQRTAN